VVHTTPSLGDEPIEDYSMRVAEAWKAGHAGLDNGVILTVAPNEKKLRIEVGYGLEGVIPDAVANRIIQEVMLPEIRSGRMVAAIGQGVAHLMAAASGEPAPPRPRRSGRGGASSRTPLVWLVLLLLFFGSRGLFFLPFLGGARRAGIGYGGMRGGFGGGGFGGGGFGGGGGGFGGGGASGGW